MSPEEMYRAEKARHQRLEDARWRELQRAVERQERDNHRRHRPTQGEGRGTFQMNYE